MRILIGLLAILIGIKVLKKVSKLIMILAILLGIYLCKNPCKDIFRKKAPDSAHKRLHPIP